MRTLIVEDEITSKIILEKILSPYGEVQVCSDGNEAIEAYRTSLDEGIPYDLVCMDFMMPEIDGHMALITIRNIEKEKGISENTGVKVIMTTGLSNIETEYDGIQNICDAFIYKPINKDALINTLTKLGFSLPQ